MVDDKANEELVCGVLEDDPGRLEGVLDAMDDFAKLHEVGEGEEGQGEEDQEATQVEEGMEIDGGAGVEVGVVGGSRKGTARAIRAMVEQVRAR